MLLLSHEIEIEKELFVCVCSAETVIHICNVCYSSISEYVSRFRKIKGEKSVAARGSDVNPRVLDPRRRDLMHSTVINGGANALSPVSAELYSLHYRRAHVRATKKSTVYRVALETVSALSCWPSVYVANRYMLCCISMK